MGNLTGIAINGLTDGAANMTFDWNFFNGTVPVITQVAGASSTSSTQQGGSAIRRRTGPATYRQQSLYRNTCVRAGSGWFTGYRRSWVTLGWRIGTSNVDIATEFANLIVAQCAFEANAKAVTTFDQITQDTINLKQGVAGRQANLGPMNFGNRIGD